MVDEHKKEPDIIINGKSIESIRDIISVKPSNEKPFYLLEIPIRRDLIENITVAIGQILHNYRANLLERQLILTLTEDILLSQKLESVMETTIHTTIESIIEKKLDELFNKPTRKDESKPKGSFIS